MKHRWSIGFGLCALLAALYAPSDATANSEAISAGAAPRIKLDASGKPAYLKRFKDGPRRVPVARGANKARAQALGIGSSDAARKLLHTKPSPELVRAVTGESTRDLLWPVVGGHFGRGFGMTRRLRPNLPHNGVDIGAPEGSIVRAVADGLVVYSDNGLTGFGNCVMILHPNGFLSLYAHNQRTLVPAGYRVRRGERIALVGQTGYAWGPHLHFELRDNGRLRDPERLFSGRKSVMVLGPTARGTSAQADVVQKPGPSKKVAQRPTTKPAAPSSKRAQPTAAIAPNRS
ncbi:MAG TPA: M23 family metallopeptidase [Polyangiales bacterium]|nr:M23 family metallopeptidase [Polyangiales bacterium]